MELYDWFKWMFPIIFTNVEENIKKILNVRTITQRKIFNDDESANLLIINKNYGCHSSEANQKT